MLNDNQAIESQVKESGKAAYLTENKDRVIFESGNVYEFVYRHNSDSAIMRLIERRKPFTFDSIASIERNQRYGYLGHATILLTDTPNELLWEY